MIQRLLRALERGWVLKLRRRIRNYWVSSSKPLADSKFYPAFHPSTVNEMSTRVGEGGGGTPRELVAKNILSPCIF